jgi:hypothetical protein
MAGMRLLAQGVNATFVKPEYDPTKMPVIAHVVPAIDNIDEDGNPCKKFFLPYRDNHGEEGLTNFFYRTPVITAGIGDDRQTFIPYDVADNSVSMDDTYYGVLYRRIDKAISEFIKGGDRRVMTLRGPADVTDWQQIFPSDKLPLTKQAFTIPRRSMRTYLAVIPLMSRGELQVSPEKLLPGANPGDWVHLLNLSGSAGLTIAKMLCEPLSENFVETAENVMDGYLHGDITQFGAAGKWLLAYHEQAQERVNEITRRTTPLAYAEASEEDDGDDSGVVKSDKAKFAAYAMTVADSVRLPVGNGQYKAYSHEKRIPADGVFAENVLANHLPINEYFDIPEKETIAKYLAIGFRKAPDVLYYGMADEPDFFTSDVKAILAAAVSVPTGDGIKQNNLAADPAADTGDDDDDFVPAPSAPSSKPAASTLKKSQDMGVYPTTVQKPVDPDTVAAAAKAAAQASNTTQNAETAKAPVKRIIRKVIRKT